MNFLLRVFCVGAMCLLLTSAVARAQLSTAELSGRVTDESGAVLPGATVTVTQTDTGLTRNDVTGDGGMYVLSNLPTGPYRLEVSLSGFRSYVQTGIVLQVGASPVINAVLSVGSLEETVTVEGATPLVRGRGIRRWTWRCRDASRSAAITAWNSGWSRSTCSTPSTGAIE